MPRARWTRDRVLHEVRRLHARGESLSARNVQALGLGGMVATSYRLFGSWRAAVDEAGVDAPVTRTRKWGFARIVARIRALARKGRDVSFSAVRASEPALVDAVYRHPELGNWHRALEAAGLDPAGHRQRDCWSRQRIIDGIHAMVREGQSLAFSEARRRHPKLVGAACSTRHFGGWGKAVAAAGYDYEQWRLRRRWTKERIIATIRHLHARQQPLTVSALVSAGWGALVTAARRRTMFGTWSAALTAAGIEVDCAQSPGDSP